MVLQIPQLLLFGWGSFGRTVGTSTFPVVGFPTRIALTAPLMTAQLKTYYC